MGPSCSTHNPRPVDPRPRAIGRLKAEVGRTRRRTTTSGCLRGNQKGCEAGKGAGSGIGAPSPGLGAPSGGMRVPGPAATTLAESIRATTLRPSRPLPSTHTRLQDDHTTSSSDLSARLRHEETATPGRGTDREPSGVSVRAERPSLARATRSTRIRQALVNNGDIPRGRVRVVPGGIIRRRRGQQSRPPTRHLSPAARKCHRTRRMSPTAAPECGASVASRATGAPTTPAPTSNHEFRAPTGARSGQVGEGMGTPRDAQVRQARATIPHRSGMSSPLSQQPGTLGEDRQVHPVAGTDPLLRTAQVSLDG